MIFQTQLKHCFTKYECQLQGWVAWIQISTWLALHWTDFGACPAVSSAEKGCTEIFHENRDRHWKPTGTPPAPDLPSRAESKATSSVLQFVKVEQDTLLPCGRGEWKRQTSNSSSLLFWAESMEQKSWWVLLPGLGQYHMHQQHHWGKDQYKHQNTPNLIKKGTLREGAHRNKGLQL